MPVLAYPELPFLHISRIASFHSLSAAMLNHREEMQDTAQ